MSGAPAITEALVRQRLERIPYARFLGMTAELRGDELTLILPFKPDLIGNPMLPALHGGAVGAFMEIAALATLMAALPEQARAPKTIDISIDYLRSGRPVDTYARARMTKLGRRIANVQVEAWQTAKVEPIAVLHGHFLVESDEADPSEG